MNVSFLLFVIAVLLFAIFWELCKINSRLKKVFPTPPSPQTSEAAERSNASAD